MYTMINGKKGNIVVEMNHISKTRSTMSVLDLNWETGASEVLVQSYFENGKQTAAFNALKEDGDRVYNCIEPQPSGDLGKSVDNSLDYFACGGLAYDTHPTLAAIKAAIVKGLESVKNAGSQQPNEAQVKSMEANYNYLSSLLKSIQGKVSGYKFETSILGGLLKQLAEEIAELKERLRPDVQLVPFHEASDLAYDEVTDTEIKLTFTLVEKATGLPYTKEPVGIDMAFVKPGTPDAVYMETKFTSTVNGMVTFKFNPTTIPDYEQYTKLTARYAFSGDDWDPSAKQDITLQYMQPKLVLADGSAVPYQPTFFSGQKKTFKLVNADGRDIPVNYNDVTLVNSNNKVQYTMLKGTEDFDLTLSHDESADQLTTLEVMYKQKPLQTISAIVAPPCGNAPEILGLSLDCSPKGLMIKVAFKADGPGILPYAERGACDMAGTCYPVRLYFFMEGATRYEIAANGYSAELLSGTVNEGVVAIYLYDCAPGKSPQQSMETNYPNVKWQVQLITRCNKRSAIVDL